MEKQIKAVVAGIVGRSRSTRQGEFLRRTFWKKTPKKTQFYCCMFKTENARGKEVGETGRG